MWSRKAIAQLDSFLLPHGPCGICGHRDARHRLWDIWIEMADARSETAEEMAMNWGEPLAHVEAVLRIRPYHRGCDHDAR